jgi:uncharacterized protein YecE (DUF72 family)
MPSNTPVPAPKASSRAKSIARAASHEPSRYVVAHTDSPEIRIGCSGWHYRSWRGPFYPPEVGATGLLSFYAQRFDTTEINSAFYRLPTENAVEAWRQGTPEGFLFAWKVSRFITHMKRLKDIEDSIALVFGRMAGLGNRLGPALFQLPPNFEATAETKERVKRCLEIVPTGRRCAFEFRHPSWYEDAVFDLLRNHNAALCISDHAAAPAPWIVTADFVYLRAHGTSGRYEGSYGPKILGNWRDPIESWRKAMRDVYVYFDNDIKSAAPADASELLRIVADR